MREVDSKNIISINDMILREVVLDDGDFFEIDLLGINKMSLQAKDLYGGEIERFGSLYQDEARYKLLDAEGNNIIKENIMVFEDISGYAYTRLSKTGGTAKTTVRFYTSRT